MKIASFSPTHWWTCHHTRLVLRGLAAGTAGWFRVLDSTEAAGSGLGVVDGTVTATGGGGDLTLNTTTISVGVDVEVTSGSITMPAS